jgi:hypothetical protein
MEQISPVLRVYPATLDESSELVAFNKVIRVV